jgi:hypothetical protein
MRDELGYSKSEVPAGRSGDWAIVKLSLEDRRGDPQADTRPDCFKFRAGQYTCLRCGNIDFMTDLYDEWWTQREAIRQAHARGGNVLITGLGLGLVVEAIMKTAGRSVNRILVIERSPDVITLLGPYLESHFGRHVEIINADAFTWEPPAGQRFSVGWHDIWPNPHAPGVEKESAYLEQRYAAYCDWQGSWITEYRAAEQGP